MASHLIRLLELEAPLRLLVIVVLVLVGGLIGAITTALHDCDIRHLRWWAINTPLWLGLYVLIYYLYFSGPLGD